MELKVCKNCRRLFQYIYGPEICPDCIKALSKEKTEEAEQDLANAVVTKDINNEKELFERVKEYIIAHPKATISDISGVMDVTPKQLFEWIREERLEFSEDSKDAWFECEKCGTKIKSGRLCSRCKGLR